METSASFEARSAPSLYPTGSAGQQNANDWTQSSTSHMLGTLRPRPTASAPACPGVERPARPVMIGAATLIGPLVGDRSVSAARFTED